MAHPDKHIILGVHITDRVHHAGAVQDVLTTCGCSIKTRIGLHDVQDDFCSPNGVVLLEMAGKDDEVADCAEKLAAIDGVDVQKMVFEH